MTLALFLRTPRMSCCLAASIYFGFGCSSTMMDNDSAGRQMNQGIGEVRSGLTQTQSGVNEIKNNTRSSGIADVESGMSAMNQGVTDMHTGMNMMSSGMMMNCVDGGSTGMMDSMQEAMGEMRQGQMMLASDASTDDAEALTHMNNGQSMMGAALDQAQSSMNCMGHGSMTSGGGMM